VKAPVIAGKYSLLRKLGAGGMAEVFLAKQASEGNFEKLVVIKRILPHLASGPANEDFVKMFLDEARLAATLRHPNIVNVVDVGKEKDTHYIVMEFLHGQDVRKMQRKNAAWSEQIPFGHCGQIVIDAAAGLHYAHVAKDLQGRALSIVHRDVSPQNIIITYEGSTKIVDFGIAKAATQSTHTSAGVLKGKYTYMSPEQATGDPVDARTDQFALGIVLWELLTMRRLFKRDTEALTLDAITNGNIPKPSRFREDLPKSLDDVVMKSLAKDRELRFSSCEEMAFAIEESLAKEGIVHSQARLSQYMRRLFADTLAEEATLGLVNPDGSVIKNLTPFSLPQGEAAAREEKPPVEATTADRKGARSKDETGSKKKPAADVDLEPPNKSDPTIVDDKKKQPKSDRGDREKVDRDKADRDRADREKADRERADREKADRDKADRERAAREKEARESDRDRSGTPSREKHSARSTPRPPSPRQGGSIPWVTLGAGGLAAAILVGGFLAWSSWRATGPATLIVRSEPRGAAVMIDGKPTGQLTPALLRDVEAGVPHRIHVELAGKQPVDEIVTIDHRGQTLEMHLDIR
jgi:serine/threonine-protein kinase